MVKTARVYYIFKKPSPNKKVQNNVKLFFFLNKGDVLFVYAQIPKDWHLLLAVLLIVMVELSYVVPLLVLGLIDSTVGRQQSKDHQPAFNVRNMYKSVMC